MTFEERLDRLVERHEALTQSVELIAHLQQKNEETLEKNQVLMGKNQVLMAQVIESIHGLSRIAHAHDQRISDLERPS
jgi:hypothetical protein